MARIRVVLLGVFALGVVGCANQPTKLRTETQEVFKPILYCPAPQQIEKPELAIYSIEPGEPDGETVKKYKATINQLLNYTNQLESQLQRYDDTNDAYKELRKEFVNKKEQDGFVDESN